jgi:multiple sugar transport system permease protein
MTAAGNTAIYASTTVAGILVGGMVLALLMHREFPGQRIVRTLMLTPWVVPSFVVAILWQFMWQSDVGIVNKILVDYTGLVDDRPVWLLGPNTMWAMVIPSIWRGLPFAMLNFLAGLQAVPKELHEAAAIDGAGAWRTFWKITFPLLKPGHFFVATLSIIGALKMFDQSFIASGGTGGPNYSTTVVVLYLYRTAFYDASFGYAAAMGIALLLIIFTLTLLQRLIFGRAEAA